MATFFVLLSSEVNNLSFNESNGWILSS